MQCPDENELLRFFEGRLQSALRLPLEAHLDRCEECQSVLSAAEHLRREPPATGRRLGRYRLERVIGEGAMGRVYEATDTQLGRRVALKIIHGGDAILDAEALWQRTVGEAQAMARLSHPNLVTVFDASIEDGVAFVAMELCEGQPLPRWVAEKRRPLGELIAVFAQLADGLATAHRAGIVHRDIKPQNILIEPNGKPRLTDFGLAFESAPLAKTAAIDDLAVTRTGALVGTPAYMAPEHFDGRPGPLSDQFSFCATLYEALAQERPFTATQLDALRAAVGKERPRRPARCPAWLYRLILKGLSPDPARRHRDLEAVRRALLRGRLLYWFKATAAATLIAFCTVWALVSQEVPPFAPFDEEVFLAQGEERVFEFGGVTRISIGDPLIADVASTGKLSFRLIGRSPGETTLLLWTKDRRRTVRVRVSGATSPAAR